MAKCDKEWLRGRLADYWDLKNPGEYSKIQLTEEGSTVVPAIKALLELLHKPTGLTAGQSLGEALTVFNTMDEISLRAISALEDKIWKIAATEEQAEASITGEEEAQPAHVAGDLMIALGRIVFFAVNNQQGGSSTLTDKAQIFAVVLDRLSSGNCDAHDGGIKEMGAPSIELFPSKVHRMIGIVTMLYLRHREFLSRIQPGSIEQDGDVSKYKDLLSPVVAWFNANSPGSKSIQRILDALEAEHQLFLQADRGLGRKIRDERQG